MKRKMSYRVILMSGIGFDIDVENKIDRIEFSNINKIGGFNISNPEEIRTDLLLRYVPNYTKCDLNLKKSRKDIADYYKSEIDKLYSKIEEYRLVIQLCNKNKLVMKEAK